MSKLDLNTIESFRVLRKANRDKPMVAIQYSPKIYTGSHPLIYLTQARFQELVKIAEEK